MKFFTLFCILLLLGVVAAQDSTILPGWETREPGYDLRVMAEGEGGDSGPYSRIITAFLNRRAIDLGASCVQYEKLVWRKQNADFEDLSLFNRQFEHENALFDQFNFITKTAVDFNSFYFHTSGPVIVGNWSFITGKILEGDTKDTLYFFYEACRAL